MCIIWVEGLLLVRWLNMLPVGFYVRFEARQEIWHSLFLSPTCLLVTPLPFKTSVPLVGPWCLYTSQVEWWVARLLVQCGTKLQYLAHMPVHVLSVDYACLS